MAKKEFFPKVKEAREALRERAVEILERYLEVVKQAQADGDHEVALKSLQWLMEHMPEDEGVRVVDGHVDRKQEVIVQPQATPVQIGIQLGGINTVRQKRLPKPTVKSEPIDG